jgi:hypothetical protein
MAQGAGEGRSGWLSRLRGDGGGRSSFVYIVVGIVALTLTVLLAIIYFSASERERTSPPICTDIALADAERAILAGEVERLTVVYAEGTVVPTSDRYGPVLAKLDFTDGTCSNLPQGVAHQDVVYTITGVIAFYNQETEDQKVDVVYQKSANLREDLFAPPTATATIPPTETPTAPPSPTEAATPATIAASPIASPAPTLPPLPTATP